MDRQFTIVVATQRIAYNRRTDHEQVLRFDITRSTVYISRIHEDRSLSVRIRVATYKTQIVSRALIVSLLIRQSTRILEEVILTRRHTARSEELHRSG